MHQHIEQPAQLPSPPPATPLSLQRLYKLAPLTRSFSFFFLHALDNTSSDLITSIFPQPAGGGPRRESCHVCPELGPPAFLLARSGERREKKKKELKKSGQLLFYIITPSAWASPSASCVTVQQAGSLGTQTDPCATIKDPQLLASAPPLDLQHCYIVTHGAAVLRGGYCPQGSD